MVDVDVESRGNLSGCLVKNCLRSTRGPNMRDSNVTLEMAVYVDVGV